MMEGSGLFTNYIFFSFCYQLFYFRHYCLYRSSVFKCELTHLDAVYSVDVSLTCLNMKVFKGHSLNLSLTPL